MVETKYVHTSEAQLYDLHAQRKNSKLQIYTRDSNSEINSRNSFSICLSYEFD